MEFVSQLMRSRRSVRSYDGRPLHPRDIDKLLAFSKTLENPYGIPIEFILLDTQEHGLSSPVITGESHYLAAKLPRVPHAEEALGYAMEHLMLYALSLGIGSVWIGGTMNRSLFEQAVALRDGECMPCVTPLGYPSHKPSLRDSLMRKGIHADHRRSFDSLFFDGSFASPLLEGCAGRLAEPLEMVRLAPSAVNKQPWRVVISDGAAHFYLKHAPGFIAGNMQRIDMGIALCHFNLSARENGFELRFSTEDPGLAGDSGTEYIASWHFE